MDNNSIFAAKIFKEKQFMARPIKETPILYGEDARRFEARMRNVQKETSEQKKVRLEHYQVMLAALQRGDQMRREGKAIPGIVKVSC